MGLLGATSKAFRRLSRFRPRRSNGRNWALAVCLILAFAFPVANGGMWWNEVLRQGVRVIQKREARLAALDVSIARGLADADGGRTKRISDVFRRLEAKYGAMASGSE